MIFVVILKNNCTKCISVLNFVIYIIKFFFERVTRNMPMDVITWFDKIICDDSNLKKRICLINVLTVALFSCLEMICEFRHLKFFKLLWDHVYFLNQLYWYFWLYCKKNCTKYIPVFWILLFILLNFFLKVLLGIYLWRWRCSLYCSLG